MYILQICISNMGVLVGGDNAGGERSGKEFVIIAGNEYEDELNGVCFRFLFCNLDCITSTIVLSCGMPPHKAVHLCQEISLQTP